MSSKAYLVPEDNLTYMDQQRYRIAALAGGVQRAYNMGVATWDHDKLPLTPDRKFPNCPDLGQLKDYIGGGGWPDNLDVRQFQPNLDAGAGAALDFWFTAAMAGALGTEVSAIGAVIPAPALNRIKKIVSWWRVSVLTSPMPMSRLLFRRNGVGGLLQAEFDLEQLACEERVVGYFSEPVVWDNNTPYAITVAVMIATGVAAKLILDNFVIEPAGTTNV